MPVTSADAARMYPVWKWLGLSQEEFRERVEDRTQRSDNGMIRQCAVEFCLRTFTDTVTLCSVHRGTYHRKRAQVIQSMGA